MDRRTFIAAAGIYPVSAVPITAASWSPLTSDYGQLVDRWRHARRQYEHFYETVSAPAEEALCDELNAVPHYTARQSFAHAGGATYPTTAVRWHVEEAEFNHRRQRKETDYDQAFEELWEAHHDREAMKEAIRSRHHPSLKAKEMQEERLRDLALTLGAEALEYHVTNFGELAAKARFISELMEDSDDWRDVADVLIADIRRLETARP
jgi:hypothetical protein